MINDWPQNVGRVVVFKAFLSSDHITPATGKTIAIQISKNGGTFGNIAAGATNATEIANGWYQVTLGAADFDTIGDLVVRGTEGTIDPAERMFNVVDDRFYRSQQTIVKFTCGNTGQTTTNINMSSTDPAMGTNRWRGRVVIFDINTPTPGLRGQAIPIYSMTATDITTGVSAAEDVALTVAAANGDFGVIL